jgi:hypothetical protein
VPIAYRYDQEIEAIVLTVSGVVTWPERKIMLRVAEFLLAELEIKNVLVDCSRLTKNGDVEQAFEFGKLIAARGEVFRGLRMALLPAPNFFFIPSVAVGAVQALGITVVECADEHSARQWLAEGRQAA